MPMISGVTTTAMGTMTSPLACGLQELVAG